MTSAIPGDAQSPTCPHSNDTNSFCFSTYMDNNTENHNRTKENNKENISAKTNPEVFKYNIDFDEYLRGVPENEYTNYFEGFNEIRRLDHILFEKIIKEKEVKMQSALLQKQLREELEKIKKTGRIEMRDEKANTEKFFALTYTPKHRSGKKDDTTDSIFAYSPFFKTWLLKPEDDTESDSSRSISTMVNEYTEKKTRALTFDDEHHFLEDFKDDSESVKDKILQSELSSADIVKDTNSVKDIVNEISNEGLKDETTDKKSLNQEVSDMISDPVSSYDLKLVQVTSNNSLSSTPTNVNPDQMRLSVVGSNQNISCEPLTQVPSDVVLDQLVLSNTSSSQNINNKSLNQLPYGQVVLTGTGSSQNINIEFPNKVPIDVVSDQVVLSNKGSSQSISFESPHQAPSDSVLDQVGLSNTYSNQNISSESPAEAPSGMDSDQVGLISEGLNQYNNNKSLNQSPSELVGFSGTDLSQELNEVVSSEIRLSFSNESLQLELSEMPPSPVQIKEATSSQDEEHTQMKKKTKKNFIKRNIQLAKDADSAVSMTPEEKNRIEDLLQDLDTLYETPKELQISDLATKDSLLSQREDGFLSSQEDRTSLAEIDYKLRYLMTPSEFEMIALKHRSPTPTQRLFSTVSPPCDTFALKQFGEKILLDTKEERNMKERLTKIDEQLYDINTRNIDYSEGNSTLEPDVLQDLLESCAVSLTESAANSLCTTARSTNSSLDEDLMRLSNLSRQSPSDVLSSIMKSPPCLADDVLQKLLMEAAPMKYKPLSPISDRSNTPDHSIFRRSCSNLSSCTLSSFNSPRKEFANLNVSASQSPSKVQDYSLPELSCRASLVGYNVSSPESPPIQL
ncbi:serine-rich adhesin for platelets isoform X3 [Octopus sinensis]|uniref:Fibrous sheath-interacting protein 1 n=1 Tax=Octopus sinensis TaxID=2607531 RepID=A0A6P7SXS4_9MOLL|nr:serine-rich adhesin for platelets isoform X3 [Octopus sinensis]